MRLLAQGFKHQRSSQERVWDVYSLSWEELLVFLGDRTSGRIDLVLRTLDPVALSSWQVGATPAAVGLADGNDHQAGATFDPF